MRNSRPSHPALSASRVKEYQRCPLQFRLHVVDRVKEPPTQATLLGTTVHSALENLYAAPRMQRDEALAHNLLEREWKATLEQDPAVMNLFQDHADFERWYARMRSMISNYFQIEEPRALEPHSTEALVEGTTQDGVHLLGYIDRVDRAPNGDLRVIDYKTGKAPSVRFQEEALFQMRFYALLLSLTERLPKRTQLVYLASQKVLTFDPDPVDIDRLSAQLSTLWEQIRNDAVKEYFPPRKNPLCNWCGVQQLCPLFNGETPKIPQEGLERLLAVGPAPR